MEHRPIYVSHQSVSRRCRAAGIQGDDMLRFCFDHGLASLNDLDEPNYMGLPPIWLALLNENWGVVSLLRGLGASIDHDVGHGFTPLVYALMIDHQSLVQGLVEMGADSQVRFFSATDHFWHHTRCDRKEYDYYKGLRPFEISLRHRIRNSLLNPTKAVAHKNTELEVTKPLEELLDVMMKNYWRHIDQKGGRGLSVSTSLFWPRKRKYIGDKKEQSHIIVACSEERRHMLTIILEKYQGCRMAADPHGNTLIELSLWDNDFESCKTIMRGCTEAVERFSQYWTLDRFMDIFVGGISECLRAHPNGWNDPPPGWKKEAAPGWAFIITEGLEALLEAKLCTAADIAGHPLFCKLLCCAIRHMNSLENCRKHRNHDIPMFLMAFKPPADQLKQVWFKKTPLEHAVRSRRPALVEKILSAGINPNEPNPISRELPVADLRRGGYCLNRGGRCRSTDIFELLRAYGLDVGTRPRLRYGESMRQYPLDHSNMMDWHDWCEEGVEPYPTDKDGQPDDRWRGCTCRLPSVPKDGWWVFGGVHEEDTLEMFHSARVSEELI